MTTILISLFVACTRQGKQAWAHVRLWPRRRRVHKEASAATAGQGHRAWLTNPVRGETFDGEIKVKGRVLDLPENHEAWLVHRIPNSTEIWPKEKLTPDNTGWFDLTTLEGGKARSMAVVVLLTPKEVSQSFENWFQQGRRTGHFPSIQLPPSAHVLASAVVRCEATQ
ncbi:hypothetical protein [Streptomyces sp. NPDC001286]